MVFLIFLIFLIDIINIDIPNGFPLVCEFDEDMKFLRKYYLGNESDVKIRIQSCIDEGKSDK